MARQLAEAVAACEARSGQLWCEGGEHFGAVTDTRLQWHERPFASPLAHRLHGLVRNLPLNGFERSFKLLAGQLWRDRFLVGLKTSSIAAEDIDHLAACMEAPGEFRIALRAHLPHACFVHVGFEGAAERSIYKMYLEFPRSSPDAPPETAMPLYLGCKWDPLDNGQRAVSVYRQPASLSSAEVREKIANAYGDAPREFFQMAEALVAETARRRPAQALGFVEVTDGDARRLSFDVKLYEGGLRLRDVAPQLLPLAERLGIPLGEVAALMDQAGHDIAGHVSGGTDRHGRAFLTIYHAQVGGAATP